MTEDDLWRELVACILGSRVRYAIARRALLRVAEVGLLARPRRSSCFDLYEREVTGALSGQRCDGQSRAKGGRYPFWRSRGRQIRRAAEKLYGNGGTVQQFVDDGGHGWAARRRLASEVPGLGPKQASLFLRNTGRAVEIAVLDAHVLSYMSWTGLTKAPVRTISSIDAYERLEGRFIEHSRTNGYIPAIFDLAVWVVVKVAKEEYGWR